MDLSILLLVKKFIVRDDLPLILVTEDGLTAETGLRITILHWNWNVIHLLGEPLGEYHKIETIKTLNIYFSAYQAIIRTYMKLFQNEITKL